MSPGLPRIMSRRKKRVLSIPRTRRVRYRLLFGAVAIAVGTIISLIAIIISIFY